MRLWVLRNSINSYIYKYLVFYLHVTNILLKTLFVLLKLCPIRPQLEGRAPVASSAAVTGRASQENTDVTVWQTAQMGLMREIAVSLLQGGFHFFYLRLLWHFNQFVKIKRLAD